MAAPAILLRVTIAEHGGSGEGNEVMGREVRGGTDGCFFCELKVVRKEAMVDHLQVHLMPPYGTPPHPYVAMYPPGGIYAHPSMPPRSGVGFLLLKDKLL
ncbi:hypothetical protein L2E82_00760 [Cichorium intybus]|uniref:Uncharacterized protein n=1 Tax=Cichorium intybus TaxID=13427 RepID=A0ACB9GZF1_CICIN|nr:hypothetical protein L2E82_00760 [Cichorium intybus]